MPDKRPTSYNDHKHRTLIENLQDLVFRFELFPTPHFSYVSPNSTQFIGYSPQEHYDDPQLGMKIIHPDDRHLLEHFFDEEIKQEKSITFRWISKSGEEIWTEQRVYPLCDKTGKLIAIDGIARDVTGQVMAQNALKESEAKFRSYIENAPDGIFIADKTGRYLEVNPAASKITGYPEEELLTMSIPDLLHSSDIQKGIQHFNQVNETGSAQDIIGFVTQDGEHRFWNVQAVKLSDDRFLGFVKDITNQVHTEIQLRQNDRRYRQAQKMGRVGNWEYNLQTTHFWGSDEAKRIYGFASDTTEFTTDEVENCIPERERVHQALIDLIESDKPYNLEFEIITRDKGESRFIHSLAELDRDEDGVPLKVIGLIKDITEERNLKAMMLQSQKLESIGRLAGGVAHDLNNTLGIITGFTELVQNQLERSDPLHGDLQEVLDAASRSTAIVRQLLAFARRQTITPELLDLNKTIEGMLKMLHRLIGEDIKLIWRPTESPCPVKMDPSQIDQILVNLLVNARTAIKGVGTITVETQCVSLDSLICSSNPEMIPGNYVVLSISDTGTGMDKVTQSRIFEPFFTTHKDGKSSGLGLATTFGIVKQNQGFINVYSELNKGTTFKIYLTHHAGQVQDERQNSLNEPAKSSGETILLVEDEPSLLKLGTHMLKRLDYRVLAANSPSDAIDYANTSANTIDLLITDVIMPEMNGRELAETLRNSDPNLQVLYMSGYTADAIAHHGVLDANTHFLQKPFNMRELATKIRQILDN